MAYHGRADQADGPNELKYFEQHAAEGSFVTHSYVVFRPFMRELLNVFAGGEGAGGASGKTTKAAVATGQHPVVGYVDERTQSTRSGRPPMARPVAQHNFAHDGNAPSPWLVRALRCINPAHPNVGFSEISSYISHVIANHREAVEIEPTMSWARNPKDRQWPKVRKQGYCCNLDFALDEAAGQGLHFLGTELGHDSILQKNGNLGRARKECVADYTQRKELFLTSAYPPIGNSYWRDRNVSFSASSAAVTAT